MSVLHCVNASTKTRSKNSSRGITRPSARSTGTGRSSQSRRVHAVLITRYVRGVRRGDRTVGMATMAKRPGLGIALVLVVLAGVAACGGKDEGGGGADTTVPEDLT